MFLALYLNLYDKPAERPVTVYDVTRLSVYSPTTEIQVLFPCSYHRLREVTVLPPFKALLKT